MSNPFDQFGEASASGNPFDSFDAAIPVDDKEQDVIHRTNNPAVETPDSFGLVEMPKDFAKGLAATFASLPQIPGEMLVQAGELAPTMKGKSMAEVAKISLAQRMAEYVQKNEVPGPLGTAGMVFGAEKDALLSLFSDGEAPKVMVNAGNAMIEQNQAALTALGLAPKGGSSVSYDLGSAFGQAGIAIGLNFVSKNPVAATAYMGALIDSQAYQEARKAGKDPETAAQVAAADAYGQGMLELMGGKIFIAASASSGFFRKVLFRAAEQGVEESSQQVAEEAVMGASGVRNTSMSEKIWSVIYNGALGFIVGAPLGAVVTKMEDMGRKQGLPEKKISEITDAMVRNKDQVIDGATVLMDKETAGVTNDEPMRADTLQAVKGVLAEQTALEQAQAAGNTEDPGIAAKLILKSPQYAEDAKSAVRALPQGFTMEQLQEAAGAPTPRMTVEASSAKSLYSSVPHEPLGLADWVVQQGGLQDTGGDVRHVIGGAKNRPGLVNKRGVHIDDLALRAWEDGYFPGDNRPSINEFLDKLTQDLKGTPHYSEVDIAAAETYQRALAHNAEIDRISQELGIDTKGKTAQQFWNEVAQKKSLEEWERENAERAESSKADLEYWQRKEKQWLESRGEAWEPEQIKTRTLEDLENEWQQEKSAGNLLPGQDGVREEGTAGANPSGVQGGNGQGGRSVESAGRAAEKRALYQQVLDAEKQGGIGEKAADIRDDVKQMLANALVPISTRLKNIHENLKTRLRKHEFELRKRINEDQAAIEPFLRKFKALSQEDRTVLDFAMKNGDTAIIEEIAAANGMTAEVKAVRKMLDGLYARAKEIGLDVSYRDNYFPRQVLKPQKLIAHFRGTEEWGQISEAIREKERELGTPLDAEAKAELINSVLRGYGKAQILLAKPANLKTRRIDTITPDITPFYASTDQALLRYVAGVNTNIETRRFLGRGSKSAGLYDRIEDSIGWFVMQEMAQGNVKPSQEAELTEILQSRFKQGNMGAFWRTYKNVEYASTMGSVTSSITQLGDLAFSLYKNGVYRTLKPLPRAVAAQVPLVGKYVKQQVTRADIGIEEIAQEFHDQTTLGKAVRGIFRLIGFDKLDALGKETLINGALLRYQAQAKKPTQTFEESLRRIFGDETEATIADLREGKISDNVKLLLFNELLDVQPVALSEMPASYLKMGNGKILYMLKTFTIKQFDVYRNEVFSQLRDNPVQGMKNLTRLMTFFVLMNAGASYLKDLLLGRDTPLQDNVINNILQVVGLSKFQVYTARKEGLGSMAGKTILPPFSVIDKAYKDIAKSVENGKVDPQNLQSVQNLPVAGKLYYWWMGAGAKQKKSAPSKSGFSTP